MSRAETLPFLTLGNFPGNLGRWHHMPPSGDPRHVSDYIPGWDIAYPLAFRRDVIFDAAGARRTCDLKCGVALKLVVIASCSHAPYRSCVYDSGPICEEWFKQEIFFRVPSEQLASSLVLELLVLLGEDAEGDGFSAKRAGSRLYQEQNLFRLEGNSARLPMEELDFAQSFRRLRIPDAAWHISINASGPEVSAQRSLRLYLNTRRPEIIDAVAAGHTAILSLLKADIARQIVATVIDFEDFSLLADRFPDDSLGQAAGTLLRAMFPGAELATIRSMRRSEPELFEAMIQSITAPKGNSDE